MKKNKINEDREIILCFLIILIIIISFSFWIYWNFEFYNSECKLNYAEDICKRENLTYYLDISYDEFRCISGDKDDFYRNLYNYFPERIDKCIIKDEKSWRKR